MAPKEDKNGKDKKSKPLGPKPVHMSDEQWVLANSVPKLVEVVTTPERHSARGPRPLATRAQAGLWLWQYLYPENSARRDEGVKAGCIEVCAKLISGQDQQVATAALGILQTLMRTEQAREAVLSARPSILTNLLNLLASDSTSLAAAAAGVLCLLAQAPDTRVRVMKAITAGSLSSVLAATKQQAKLPLMGGRSACCDATAVLEAVCVGPGVPLGSSAGSGKDKAAKEGDGAADKGLTEAVQKLVLAAGGLATLLEVCKSHGSTAPAKASAANALYTLLRAHGSEPSIKAAFSQHGGVEAMVKLMGHSYLPLITRAHAAGCLLHYLQPKPRVGHSFVAATTSSGGDGELIRAAGLAHNDSSLAAAEVDATAAAAASSTAANAGGGGQGLQQQAPAVLDQEGQLQLMTRLHEAAEAVPVLLQLCLGPEGALPEITRPEVLEHVVDAPIAEEAEEGDAAGDEAGSNPGAGAASPKKSKKKKGGSKKKAKLEPGMAEAQTLASACLCLMSLCEELRGLLATAACVRHMLPLVAGSVNVARWNARQTLLNLSILPAHCADMAAYDTPKYIVKDNIPKSHYQPIEPTSLPPELQQLNIRISNSSHGRAPGSAMNSARRTSRDAADQPVGRRVSEAADLQAAVRGPRGSSSTTGEAPASLGSARRLSMSGRGST